MIDKKTMQEALTEVVSRGDFTVPPYPAVALRLQRLLARESYGLDEVAEGVAADAALVAAVLAAANSALLGGAAPITTLSSAVGRLGARRIASIALASSLSSIATASGVLEDVKFRVWRRGMMCALICHGLAGTRGVPPEEAFLVGLLHGFGRSIAIASLERLLETRKPRRPLSTPDWLEIAEEQRAALARAVARNWQLPEIIADAVDSSERGVSVLNDLVLDADGIARELDAGRTPEGSSPAERGPLVKLLEALPAMLEALSSPVVGAATCPHLPSLVLAKPSHALEGDLRQATLLVADPGAKRKASLCCLSLAPDGIELDSSRTYQESAIVRLVLGEGETQLEAWLTVVLCVPHASRYRVELQLFSPTREIRERWRALYDGLEPSP